MWRTTERPRAGVFSLDYSTEEPVKTTTEVGSPTFPALTELVGCKPFQAMHTYSQHWGSFCWAFSWFRSRERSCVSDQLCGGLEPASTCMAGPLLRHRLPWLLLVPASSASGPPGSSGTGSIVSLQMPPVQGQSDCSMPKRDFASRYIFNPLGDLNEKENIFPISPESVLCRAYKSVA